MNVLIVERDKYHAKGLQRVMESMGHRTDFAPSFDAAQLKLDGHPFDLLFLDMDHIPRNSKEAFDYLKNYSRDTAVIAMTDSTSFSSAFQALHADAVDILTKPVDYRKLTLLQSSFFHRHTPNFASMLN